MEREVWDVINAGPRHRFTANGSLVGNCIQDHGGNWWRHGSLNSCHEWDLDDTANILRSERMRAIREKKEPEPIMCHQCGSIRMRGSECPKCGAKCMKRTRPVIQESGHLKLMTINQFKHRKLDTRSDIQKRWDSQFIRAKRSRNRMNFNQAEALYAMDNGWRWPPRELANMPKNPRDWHTPVVDVPLNMLT